MCNFFHQGAIGARLSREQLVSIIADSSNRIYEPLAYTLEADFEKQVVSLADQIFGTQTVYADVKKHVKGDEFTTIPDGYVIDMTDQRSPASTS